jgi:uroporphyrinogen-III synthase
MLNLSDNKPLKVLITRPEQKGLSLSTHLNKLGIHNQCQPLFDFQPFATPLQTKATLASCDIVIFVSVTAVNFAHQSWPITQWQFTTAIAVGKATAEALNNIGITEVISPVNENSEGLLALSLLNKDLREINIVIVRGNSGRELLATELKKRNAQVNYLESYKRQWRTLPKTLVKHWQAQQINCIVVTSNELLQRLADTLLLLNDGNTAENVHYWKTQCVWCVASERIATLATSLGIKYIQVSDGANDEAITSALQHIWKIK